MILVFAGIQDDVEALVCARLIEKNAKFLLVDTRHYPHKLDLDYSLKNGEIQGYLHYGSEKISLSDIRSIYVRHITKSSWLWRTLLNTFPGLVINRPVSDSSNSSKPYQYQAIVENGFKVPRTLVTTIPDEVRSFHEECQGRIIYKSVSSVRSMVVPMKSEDLERLNNVAYCPVQFQECIPGNDIRVHTVGNRIFATEITTEATDYRYAAKFDKKRVMRGIELPDRIAEQCFNLTKALGLVMAGIDLYKSITGEYYCFEVNTSPGFTFYQTHGQQPIGDALVNLLCQGDFKF